MKKRRLPNHPPADLLSRLPRDVSVECLSFLSPLDLTRTAQASHTCLHLASTPRLWKHLATCVGGVVGGLRAGPLQVRSALWRDLYVELSRPVGHTVGMSAAAAAAAPSSGGSGVPRSPSSRALGLLQDSVTHPLYQLLAKGLSATTTDHETQGVEQTLNPSPNTFWSSTGTAEPDSAEANQTLVYELRQPVCLIRRFTLTPYKAGYQAGLPTYGPLEVQFHVGFAAEHMHWSSRVYAVENVQSEDENVFELDEGQFVVGGFVRVELIGRRTTQPGDELYYHAIRSVKALGHAFGTIPQDRAIFKQAIISYALRTFPPVQQALRLQQDAASIIAQSFDEDVAAVSNTHDAAQAQLEASEIARIIEQLDCDARDLVSSHADATEALLQIHQLVVKSAFAEAAADVAERLADNEPARSSVLRWIMEDTNPVSALRYLIELVRKAGRLTAHETLVLAQLDYSHAEPGKEGHLFRRIVAISSQGHSLLTASEEAGDVAFEHRDFATAMRMYLSGNASVKAVEAALHLGSSMAVFEIGHFSLPPEERVALIPRLRELHTAFHAAHYARMLVMDEVCDAIQALEVLGIQEGDEQTPRERLDEYVAEQKQLCRVQFQADDDEEEEEDDDDDDGAAPDAS